MIDHLKHIVFGGDYVLSDSLSVHNATLREISDYGQERYASDVSAIVLRPYDAAVLLDDIGKDYRTVSEFELFCAVGINLISQKSILLPGINVADLKYGIHRDTQEPFLFNERVRIDKLVFREIVDAVRAFHYIPSKIEINPGSTFAVREWIRQQRDKLKRQARKKKKPVNPYSDIVSALVNSAGFKYDYGSAEDLHISQLMDAFYRLNRIQNFQHTMSGVYAGTVDPKHLNKDVFDWFGSIDINTKRIDESKMIEVK